MLRGVTAWLAAHQISVDGFRPAGNYLAPRCESCRQPFKIRLRALYESLKLARSGNVIFRTKGTINAKNSAALAKKIQNAIEAQIWVSAPKSFFRTPE
jgi:hypothetical protein